MTLKPEDLIPGNLYKTTTTMVFHTGSPYDENLDDYFELGLEKQIRIPAESLFMVLAVDRLSDLYSMWRVLVGDQQLVLTLDAAEVASYIRQISPCH